MWYSFFLNSLIFTVSITALLLRVRKALEEVYVIVVTRFTTRAKGHGPFGAISYQLFVLAEC
jgi:hypothetical protein